METTTTSYLQNEVIDLVTDPTVLDEWHRTINELGLTGQSNIAAPDKSPIPYLHMTPAMLATFEALCPREVPLAEYSAGPIPMQALEHIKLAMRENHFHRIVIRYDDKSPDPVAIGVTGHYYTYGPHCKEMGLTDWQPIPEDRLAECRERKIHLGFTTTNSYLICRWGAEADSLENLAAKAKERYLREEGAKHEKVIKEAQATLNTMQQDATLKFGC